MNCEICKHEIVERLKPEGEVRDRWGHKLELCSQCVSRFPSQLVHTLNTEEYYMSRRKVWK